ADHSTDVERLVHRIGRDMRDRLGQLCALGRHHLSESETTEGALVDETEFRPPVSEPDPHSQVLLVRSRRRLDPQLAAHPELPQQHLTAVEFEPEILSAPANRT